MNRLVQYSVVICFGAVTACRGGGGGDGGTDAGSDAGYVATSIEVTTESGRVEGEMDLDGYTYRFPNIPFAAPPIGANRFRAPQPVTPWSTTRTYASASAPRICPQKLPLGALGLAIGDEDCLYLNVVVPVSRPTNAPVIVWIHGGGFAINSGDEFDAATNGIQLAERTGAVVVTINYRLAQFGFLAHPALTAEAGHSGNFGLLDQLAALRWVKRNVASFGGDPDRITLYGQGSGGQSICALMATPLLTDDAALPPAERPLFHAAVLQSAQCDLPYRTLAEGELQGVDYATALGCTGTDAEILACLRDPVVTTLDDLRDTMPYPRDFMRAVAPEASWTPLLDGYYMPAHPLDVIATDAAFEVPVIAGFGEDEGNTAGHLRVQRSPNDPTTLRIDDQADFDAAIDRLFVDPMNDVARPMITTIAAYDPANYADLPIATALGTFTPQVVTTFEQAFAILYGDADLACPSRRMIRTFEAAGIPVHAYYYRFKTAQFQLDATYPLGAFHGGDTQYFFGMVAGGETLGKRFTAVEQSMTDTLRDYLGHFVRTDDPNGAGLPTWPAYSSATTSTHMALDAAFVTTDDPLSTRCAFWDSIGRSRLTPP